MSTELPERVAPQKRALSLTALDILIILAIIVIVLGFTLMPGMAQMKDRFDSLEGRIDRLEQRLDQINNRERP